MPHPLVGVGGVGYTPPNVFDPESLMERTASIVIAEILELAAQLSFREPTKS